MSKIQFIFNEIYFKDVFWHFQHFRHFGPALGGAAPDHWSKYTTNSFFVTGPTNDITQMTNLGDFWPTLLHLSCSYVLYTYVTERPPPPICMTLFVNALLDTFDAIANMMYRDTCFNTALGWGILAVLCQRGPWTRPLVGV